MASGILSHQLWPEAGNAEHYVIQGGLSLTPGLSGVGILHDAILHCTLLTSARWNKVESNIRLVW